jgi:hypothetical protein
VYLCDTSVPHWCLGLHEQQSTGLASSCIADVLICDDHLCADYGRAIILLGTVGVLFAVDLQSLYMLQYFLCLQEAC